MQQIYDSLVFCVKKHNKIVFSLCTEKQRKKSFYLATLEYVRGIRSWTESGRRRRRRGKGIGRGFRYGGKRELKRKKKGKGEGGETYKGRDGGGEKGSFDYSLPFLKMVVGITN